MLLVTEATKDGEPCYFDAEQVFLKVDIEDIYIEIPEESVKFPVQWDC